RPPRLPLFPSTTLFRSADRKPPHRSSSAAEEASMDDKPILVERRAGYRVITLNRPQRLNAFNEALHQALKTALVEAEEDGDCRALLLTGAGRGFCAGQDLSDRLAK